MMEISTSIHWQPASWLGGVNIGSNVPLQIAVQLEGPNPYHQGATK